MLAELIVILTVTKLGGWFAQKFGQPSVLGELLAGVIVGPSVLGLLQPSEFIASLAELGVILLMFIAGLETDLEQLKSTGGPAFLTASGGVAVPFIAGALLGRAFGLPWAQSIFAGTILTATSVSISAQTLLEMDRIKSKEGVTILGAAVIDDIMGIIVLTLVVSLTGAGAGAGAASASVGLIVGRMLFFFAVATVFGVFILPVLADLAAHRIKVSEGLLTFCLTACFLLAWGADKAGVAGITGAYLAGIFLSRTPYGHQVEGKVQTIGYALLIPIFFVNIGLNAQIGNIKGSMLLFSALFIGLAIISKIVGSTLGAKLSCYSWISSFQVGVGMIARAEVALIVAGLGLHAGLVDTTLYSTVVLLVLTTTLITPPLLRLAFSLGGTRDEGAVEIR